jgi:hypothetical protein
MHHCGEACVADVEGARIAVTTVGKLRSTCTWSAPDPCMEKPGKVLRHRILSGSTDVSLPRQLAQVGVLRPWRRGGAAHAAKGGLTRSASQATGGHPSMEVALVKKRSSTSSGHARWRHKVMCRCVLHRHRRRGVCSWWENSNRRVDLDQIWG